MESRLANSDLERIISTYSKAIENFTYADNLEYYLSINQNHIDFAKKMYYGLLHLDVYSHFIKSTENYPPILEMDMILYLLQSLPKDFIIIARTNKNVSELLKDLIQYFITVGDLLIKRVSQESLLDISKKITETIKSMDITLFDGISDLKESPMVRFIKEEFPKPLKFISPVESNFQKDMMDYISLNEENKKLLANIETYKFLNRKFTQAREFFSVSRDEKELTQQFSSQEDLLKDYFSKDSYDDVHRILNELESILTILMIVHIQGSKTNNDDFFKFIKSLQTQFSNKKNFAIICLQNFLNAGRLLSRFDGCFLLVELLLLLDEPLKAGELFEVIQATDLIIDTNILTELLRYIIELNTFQSSDSQMLADLCILSDLLLPDSSYQGYYLKYSQSSDGFNKPHRLRLFQILGKSIIVPPEIKSPPLFMDLFILDQPREVALAYGNLINKFLKVNSKALSFQKRNPCIFFSQHHHIIYQLVKLIGVNAFKEMDESLVSSALSLERMLVGTPILDVKLIEALSKYFRNYSISYKKMIPHLNALDFLINVNVHQHEDLVSFYIKISENKNPESFLTALGSLLIKVLFEEKECSFEHETLHHIFKRFSTEKFVKLATASKNMQYNSEYREIYLELLWLDLTKGDVDDFLHNVKQENIAGQHLARHNQGIRKKLLNQGISLQNALNYKKIHYVIVNPNKSKDNGDFFILDNQYYILFGYFQKLNQYLEDKEKLQLITHGEIKLKNLLLPIISSINTKVASSQNQQSARSIIVNSLKKKYLEIKKIAANCQNCLDQKIDNERKSQIPLINNIKEFSQHVKNQVEQIEIYQRKPQSQQSPDAKIEGFSRSFFRIQQFSKNEAETFFLGDEVGCCLATDSVQFHAMVQRRMDDAMLFHVAIDRSTNRPAALIWLYLAETKKGEITLIANFFEVNARYGSHSILRKALFNSLLSFTNQYIKDNPNIKNFYMNQLAYGYNQNDVTAYPIVSVQLIDKVGGAFTFGESTFYVDAEKSASEEEKEEIEEKQNINKNARRKTKEHYYLASLPEKDEAKFHLFDQKVLNDDNINDYTINLIELIEPKVSEWAKESNTIDQIIQRLISEYPIELEAFFSGPLENNRFLRREVNAILIDINPKPIFFKKPTPHQKRGLHEPHKFIPSPS